MTSGDARRMPSHASGPFNRYRPHQQIPYAWCVYWILYSWAVTIPVITPSQRFWTMFKTQCIRAIASFWLLTVYQCAMSPAILTWPYADEFTFDNSSLVSLTVMTCPSRCTMAWCNDSIYILRNTSTALKSIWSLTIRRVPEKRTNRGASSSLSFVRAERERFRLDDNLCLSQYWTARKSSRIITTSRQPNNAWYDAENK